MRLLEMCFSLREQDRKQLFQGGGIRMYEYVNRHLPISCIGNQSVTVIRWSYCSLSNCYACHASSVGAVLAAFDTKDYKAVQDAFFHRGRL